MPNQTPVSLFGVFVFWPAVWAVELLSSPAAVVVAFALGACLAWGFKP